MILVWKYVKPQTKLDCIAANADLKNTFTDMSCDMKNQKGGCVSLENQGQPWH